MKKSNIKGAIEGILFTMGNSVELSKLAQVLEIPEQEIKKNIEIMKKDYENEDRGITILELNNSYQLCSKKEVYEYLIKITQLPKTHILTDVLLETLSIIAYKQPITRSEIEKIRGVSCGHTINKLLEYNLVCELGRLDTPGRPLMFGTTEEFLRSFGVSSIDELPIINQDKIQEFKHQAEKEAELKLNI